MKAIIIGATGLVGKEIVTLTLNDPDVSEVRVFARRSLKLNHPKLREFLVNFDELGSWKKDLSGDVLFSAMGTTIKSAGSKEAQYKVDFTYQYEVAKAARENGVKSAVLVSSVGASDSSPFFYLKTKGELEEALKNLQFESLTILRPSFLEGKREEYRAGEKVSAFFLNKLPKTKALARILPVKASKVASTGIARAKKKISGASILGPDEILF